MGKLIFYLNQTHEIGGSQLAFCRIIDALSAKFSYEIYVSGSLIDFIKEFHNIEGINFIEFMNMENVIRSNTTLITTPTFLNDIATLSKNDLKILLWEMGPYSFIQNFALGNKYRNFQVRYAKVLMTLFELTFRERIRQLIEKGMKMHGIVFMCHKNYIYNLKYFTITENVLPDYVAIPISVDTTNRFSAMQNKMANKTIRIGFISRLYREKCLSLLDLIEQISKIDKYVIILYVIGTGPFEDDLRKFSSAKNVLVKFCGRIENNKLDKYILANIDIGISMGTSALEFSKLGIPTAFCPGVANSFTQKRRDKYVWVYNSNIYNLSSDYYPGCKNNKMTHMNLLTLIIEFMSSKELISSKCYDYTKMIHSFENVTKSFHSKINN